MRQAAVHLALDDHGIDDAPHVVSAGDRHQVDDSRLGVDLHLSHVSSGREREVVRIVEGRLLEARFQPLRVVVRDIRRQRYVSETQRLVGASHGELAVRKDNVRLGRLHEVGSDRDALLDDLLQSLEDGGATHRTRSGAVCAHAERHLGGVAVHDLDLIDPDAQAL